MIRKDRDILFFKNNGYLILKKVFDKESINDWKLLVKKLKEDNDRWIFGGLIEKQPKLSFDSITNSRILDMVETIMGPFVQLDGFTLVGTTPVRDHSTGNSLHWHRDPWGEVPISKKFHRPFAINVLCYLQDLTPEIGPLRVIPRSHRMPLTLSPSERKTPHPKEKLLLMKAGDVVLIHNNLIHSRTPNSSFTDRFYLSILYNHCWLKQTTNVDNATIKKIVGVALHGDDYRVMRLFGLDPKLEERANCGFLTEDEAIWREWMKEDLECINLNIRAEYDKLFESFSLP